MSINTHSSLEVATEGSLISPVHVLRIAFAAIASQLGHVLGGFLAIHGYLDKLLWSARVMAWPLVLQLRQGRWA